MLAAFFTPPEITPWAMAGAMVFAGAGGGFVISPNQTLALADVPVKQGGLAGSVGQLGQRIGTAIGTAITLSLFYSTIYRESGGSPDLAVYHDAYAVGMLAVALLIAIAFAMGVLDLGAAGATQRARRGSRRSGRPGRRTALTFSGWRGCARARPSVVLDRGAQRHPRHRRGAALDEVGEPLGVEVAGRAQHPAQGLLHERLGIVGERLGERERVVDLAALQERERRHERRASLGPEPGCREPGERRAVAVEQIAADDVARREVDEVPLVDAVVAAQVEVVELGAPLGGGASGAPPTCP